METLVDQARRFGYLFYIVNPNATTFATVEEVPNYLNESVPQFLSLVFLEMIIISLSRKSSSEVRLPDVLTSVGHGILYAVANAITVGVEMIGFEYLYQYRLFDLDWRSPITWGIAALGADLGYYWVHRCCHEINIGWGAHQVHHSSEDYNLSTAIRQSILQKFFHFGFYLPLALIGISLPAYIVHVQFNMLYQFYVHTELIRTLGPLEWILVTPSHHRVHHGSNPWCLDKNYGGVLIIWDKLFGTFQQEKEGEKIIYGLVDQPQTFNVLWLQFFYHHDILARAWSQDSWYDTVRCLLYGPAWTKGSPRLGHPPSEEDCAHLKRTKYRPSLHWFMQLYLIVNFSMAVYVHHILITNINNHSYWLLLLQLVYLCLSVSSPGVLYDGWRWAGVMEAVKNMAAIVVTSHYSMLENRVFTNALNIYCASCAVLFIVYEIKTVVSKQQNKKKL